MVKLELEDAPVPTEEQVEGPDSWGEANVRLGEAPNIPRFSACYQRVGGAFLPEGNLGAFQLLRAFQFKQKKPHCNRNTITDLKSFSAYFIFTLSSFDP